MAYSNYFNTPGSQIATTYTNTTTYHDGTTGPYGTTCAMSYSNVAYASHPIPGAFLIGPGNPPIAFDNTVFDAGRYVANSVEAIKRIKIALDKISTEKVQKSTGKSYTTTIAWSSLIDAELEPDKKIRSAQITELAENTRTLWDLVDGGPYPAPANPYGVNDPVKGETLQTIATNVQSMANCTQASYLNTRTTHDGYRFPAGTEGTPCSNSATYSDTTYNKTDTAFKKDPGYNGTTYP